MSDYIALSEVRKRGLAPVHGATLTRWILRGIKIHDRVIRLRAWRIGKKWHTTADAVKEFIDATTGTFPDDTAGGTKPRSPTQRQRDSEKAEAELIRMGC